ncbi:ABC transporter ATP-binding protein [Glaciibacter flavus]|uniref:ABC transporter ATP-binding protein n=1 Tax=Orlajensenia flava TaxID=2565934 RepID=A0A4S4G142_9MICO|nr:ABC transporter ATP-binding protein [Glaciibacter flavus]THG36115.1 ABC transporter ATP-binding protein [Glaciibacter flavus]
MTLASLLDVTRRFGEAPALDHVTLDIEPGTLVGLLGPNGAGKSTLLSLVAGLRRPTSGTVTLFGGDPRDHRNRRALGVTPQESALPPTLRVGEVIDYVGAHFDQRMPTAELAAEFGLGDLLRKQTGALSGGQRRRLSVALAFVRRPRLVLLDEPTTGLDVDGRRALWDAVRRQHEAGATLVLTSHHLEEIEALAERVIVLASGRIIADDTLESVVGRVGVSQVRLRSAESDRIASLPGVTHAERNDDGSVTFSARDADELVVALVHAGVPFTDLAIRGATLEEAFLSLTDGPILERAS